LHIGVLGYIGVVQHKEHSPEDLSIPTGTPCIRKLTDVWMFLGYLLAVYSLKIMSVGSEACSGRRRFKANTDILNRRWAGPLREANLV